MLALAGGLGVGATKLFDFLLARSRLANERTVQQVSADDARRAGELGYIFEQYRAMNEMLRTEVKGTRTDLIDCIAGREKLRIEVQVLQSEVQRLTKLVEEKE